MKAICKHFVGGGTEGAQRVEVRYFSTVIYFQTKWHHEPCLLRCVT